MNERRKSDRSVRSEKSPNKAPERAAEAMEKRDLAGGKPQECNTPRTQSRPSVPSALERLRQAVEKDGKQRFSALLHHVYDGARLKAAYEALKPRAAAGVDGVTWHEYGQKLGDNLRDLADRLRRGAYRAKPVRRVFIPKADGRQRPIGVPALEDKIVQRAVVEVLNTIYEPDFLDFSYGFRPGRGPHDALDALTVGLTTKKVNWVLDGDIRSFFDTLKHEWLIKFVQHRVADRRIVQLIQKWLNAGVLEDGKRIVSELGTVQGGSVSPLLANLYLHYVLDLWAQQWSKKRARGEMIVVRYADDFVAGFQHRSDAESFHAELRERFKQFGLELHPEKTRTLEFGRFAAENRKRRGDKSPESFNFLGFTHSCGKTRSGRWTVLRQTMAKRMQAKLADVKQQLLKRRSQPVSKQGSYVRSVVNGHVRYYGVPMNSPALGAFRFEVGRLWWRSLRRRSQRPLRWPKMDRLLKRWLPPARVCHPYPSQRFAVKTRGKSRMR